MEISTLNSALTQTKKQILIKEVIIPYHPTFAEAVNIEKINPEWFDVSLLLEEAMSHVGGYERIDCHHMDFSDGSDCKSSTINNRKRGLVDRVVSHGGKEKHGTLRVVVYNSIKQNVMYYALPKKNWITMVSIHPTNKQGSINYGYKTEEDTIPKFEEFRCKTFEELCLTKNQEYDNGI
jgi:hypothetical protein